MSKPASPNRRGKKLKPLSDLVPTNWCDSLLTGDKGIGQPPYDCRHIEKLLRGVQDRIRAEEEKRRGK